MGVWEWGVWNKWGHWEDNVTSWRERNRGKEEGGAAFPPDVYALKRSSLDRLVGLREGTRAQSTGQLPPDCHHFTLASLPDQWTSPMPCPSPTPPVSATALTTGLCALSVGTSTTSPSSATQCPGTWVSGGMSRGGQHGRRPSTSATAGPQLLKSCPAATLETTGLAAPWKSSWTVPIT